MTLVAVQDLRVGYDGQAFLPPVSLDLERGQLWAVIGPNGAGKSTFLQTVLGLLPPVGGEIRLRPGARLAYVPQQAGLDTIFPVSVLDFVLTGLQGPGNLLGRRSRNHLEVVHAALARARVNDLIHRQLRDLSGGQRQRVLMARALASPADVLFLDEPTAALDLQSERAVIELIGDLRIQRGAAVVMVTHLVEDGFERADRILLLDRDHGVALAGSPSHVRTSPAFQRIYGPVLARGQLSDQPVQT
jgi:ABC-type Mn2+/Zn2+ transport system ATPase subunit